MPPIRLAEHQHQNRLMEGLTLFKSGSINLGYALSGVWDDLHDDGYYYCQFILHGQDLCVDFISEDRMTGVYYHRKEGLAIRRGYRMIDFTYEKYNFSLFGHYPWSGSTSTRRLFRTDTFYFWDPESYIEHDGEFNALVKTQHDRINCAELGRVIQEII